MSHALPSRLHHTAGVTRDLEATRHFYEDLLGLPLIATWCEQETLLGKPRTVKPNDSQRREPLMTLPIPGIRTITSRNPPMAKSTGAYFCQVAIGTWNTTRPAVIPSTR